MTSSKILFLCSISLVVGIAAASFMKIPQYVLWAFLLVVVALFTASFFHKKYWSVLGLCLLFFILGVSRTHIAQQDVATSPLLKANDTGEKITFTGQLMDDPEISGTRQKMKVAVDGGRGAVLITAFRYPEYHYPAALEIVGKLQSPPVFEDFNYRDYLMKDGIYSLVSYPEIETKGEGRGASFLYAKILQFKRALKKSIDAQFLAPGNGIVEGILLGGTAAMSDEMKAKFQATGLIHITAISGSNIVILGSIMMAFLLWLGFWRSQAFYGSMIFIWLYIVIAGFPISGIRAAIMATMLLLAQKLGRQHASGRIIVLTAMAMLLHNPLLLRYDVGFQLSFLASLGIIYVKPLFDRVLAMIPGTEKIKGFLDIVTITFAAQLLTLPVIAHIFRQVSLISPLTNVLIIPVIDFIMVFGFLSAFLGIFSRALGFIFFLPTNLLLAYVLKVVDIFSRPWAALALARSGGLFIFVYYVTAGIMVKYLNVSRTQP